MPSKAEELLESLTDAGAILSVEEERLKYAAAPGIMTPEFLAGLREHKAELMDLVRSLGGISLRPWPKLESKSIDGRHQMTFMQHLFATSYSPATARGQHLVSGLRLKGKLRRDVLIESIRQLTRRHSILRAVLGWERLDALGWIEICPEVEVSLHDIASDDSVTGLTMNAFAEQPFELRTGPLYRFGLQRASDDNHVLGFVCHHTLADGMSLMVIWMEVLARYNAMARGTDVELLFKELPVQFTDFVRYQAEWLSCIEAHRARKYWRARLQGCNTPFPLPHDRRTPVVRDPLAQPIMEVLSAADCASLAMMCKRHDISLPTMVLGSFAVTLACWSRNADVLSWVTHAGRRRREFLPLVGCFADTWLLRVSLGDAMTFMDAVRAVNTAVMEAIRTLDLPGAFMAMQFTSVRPENLPPAVFFNYLPTDGMGEKTNMAVSAEDAISGVVTVESVNLPGRSVHLDPSARMALALTVFASETSMRWTVQYDPQYFEHERIEMVSRVFRALLTGGDDQLLLTLERLRADCGFDQTHVH